MIIIWGVAKCEAGIRETTTISKWSSGTSIATIYMSQDSSNSISTAGGIKLGNYDLNIGTDGAYCASTNLFGATSMIGVTSDLYLKYEYSYTFGWDPIYTTTIYASGSFSLPVMGAVAMISYFGPYALWTFVPATQALK